MDIDLQHHTHYWRATMPFLAGFNARLVRAFEQAADHPDQQSHHFSGRYENIHIDHDRLTDLPPLLTALRQTATRILKQPVAQPANGHWFNHMEPGQLTGLHSHDNDDELLSVVYYLKVLRHSGDLVLHTPAENIIRPVVGDAIFFDPALPHEVTRNNSDETRLSLALNFGPAR